MRAASGVKSLPGITPMSKRAFLNQTHNLRFLRFFCCIMWTVVPFLWHNRTTLDLSRIVRCLRSTHLGRKLPSTVPKSQFDHPDRCPLRTTAARLRAWAVARTLAPAWSDFTDIAWRQRMEGMVLLFVVWCWGRSEEERHRYSTCCESGTVGSFPVGKQHATGLQQDSNLMQISYTVASFCRPLKAGVPEMLMPHSASGCMFGDWNAFIAPVSTLVLRFPLNSVSLK